ncbi:MAG: hypothetical protein ACI8PQ_000373 [Planctomycetota bacterium]|jgi:uncharacterized protein YchJ
MSKEVSLALSSFLDSVAAGGLSDRAATRDLATAFFEACFGDLGKSPGTLEEHDIEMLLQQLIPARLDKADRRAVHAPAVFEALLTHVEETEVVADAWKLHRALDEHRAAFQTAVAKGTHAGTRSKKQATVAHQADKTGRNDPCWCGSGRKFKKCCGKT